MRVTLTGSGGWDGIPAPFCNCRVCRTATPGGKDFRTRPAILVEAEKPFMLELSPDIRLQSHIHALPEIRDFLVSHWHFDHLYGILELDMYTEGKPIRIFASRKTAGWIEDNFPHIRKEITITEPFRTFRLHGVEITPLPVYHETGDEERDERENVHGFLLDDGKARVAYMADYFSMPGETMDIATKADVAILDGTYLLEELWKDRPGMDVLVNDSTHLHGKEILDFAKQFGKVVFHSIGHMPRLLHEEFQEKIRELSGNGNIKIGYDGMRIC